MLEVDETPAKALEAIYETRDMLRRRRLVLDALNAHAGERVLDVGCGPGVYAADLLERVGSSGSVAGIDASEAMLALAERRAPGAELVSAPATALPFDDASFDGALSVQVLEYVEDVDRVLSELGRVLRPGGRIVLWDVDWPTVSMHSSDPDRMRRALAAWDRHLVHPSLPRTLGARLRQAGFTDVALEGHAFTTTELTRDAYGGSLVSIIESYLAGLDDFPAAEGAAWAEEQRALGQTGDFYFTCVQCCVTAR